MSRISTIRSPHSARHAAFVDTSLPTPTGTPLSDTFDFGTTGLAQSLITANVSIALQTESAAITVDDSQDTTAQTINVSSTQVDFNSTPAFSYGSTPNVASLMVLGGSGGNTFNVNSTTATTATTLDTGTGSDTVNVTGDGVADGTTLMLNGSAGTATLNYGTGGVAPTVSSPSTGVVLISLTGSGSVQATNFETINQSPAITSADSTTFTVGTAGTFTVTTVGVTDSALTETGALPSGLTFVDNGGGTATLSGTPAAGLGGTYALTITAANGVTPDATQNFTLTVDQAPAITSADTTTFTAGTAGTFTVTTTGFPNPALSETGALPTGVTFVDNGDGTADSRRNSRGGHRRHLRV